MLAIGRRLSPLLLLVLGVLLLQGSPSAAHEEDASQPVAVPLAPGETRTVQFSGTVGPGTNPINNCDGGGAVDAHAFEVQVPEGAYDEVRVNFEWRINWTPSSPSPETSDLQMTVIDPSLPEETDDESEGSSRTVGSSNTFAFGSEERVPGANLRASTYEALVCPFNNIVDQPYQGTLTVTAEPAEEPSLPSAPARGLEFSASVLADPQRRQTEPIIESDAAGNTYTCGPAGVSATEYAQVSTDGGDQFNPLGEPPQYRPTAVPGGGDCGLIPSPFANEDGQFPVALTGLGPLTNFVTATSEDTGRTLVSGNSNSVPGVDRQWMSFVDPDTVLLAYNQQPRQIVVQRSTDRGEFYETEPIPASPVFARFPGPMRSLPAKFNPDGEEAGNVAYFAFDDFLRNTYLSLSTDKGKTWKHCRAFQAPGTAAFFPTADHDSEGNIYVAVGENARFHSYLTALPIDKLAECNDKIDEDRGQERKFSTKNPGWSPAVQVDREALRTTVFTWVAAGGAPGRAAVAFYGTETDGNPDLSTFDATWHVYVSQTLDLLRPKEGGGWEANPNPTVSQVRASTHPFHYDSICLGGTGCLLTGGDRSNADFFSIEFNPRTERLQVAYNQTNKQPDDTAGQVGLTAVATQRSGPSNAGGDVETDPRPPLRDFSADPAGDAEAEYSTLAPTSRAATQLPASDFVSAQTGPEIDPETGQPVPNGGVTVTLRVADLSKPALDLAMSTTGARSLLWTWRFANGYRTGAASVIYDGSQFSFGYNGYQRAGAPECANSSCQVYRADQPIKGKVDQAGNTMVLSIPRDKLLMLTGPEGEKQRPKQEPAVPGARFYDGSAYSFANVNSASQSNQGFMERFDNTPAMDFVLPDGQGTDPGTGPGTGPGTAPGTGPGANPRPGTPPGGTPGCTPDNGLRSVAVRPRSGGRARLVFERGSGVSAPVSVDVFQQSIGRRVIGERLVARFSKRTRSFAWDGRANRPGKRVRDGYLFVRYRVRTAAGLRDTRRVALRRAGGRLSVRPQFAARETCRLLSKVKLGRPVFGGRTSTPLRVAFRANAGVSVRVEVRRGKRLVRVLRRGAAPAGRTVRLRLAPRGRGRARGDYTVRIRARSGSDRQTETLVARRL